LINKTSYAIHFCTPFGVIAGFNNLFLVSEVWTGAKYDGNAELEFCPIVYCDAQCSTRASFQLLHSPGTHSIQCVVFGELELQKLLQ
jgi:hypothetical protein